MTRRKYTSYLFAVVDGDATAAEQFARFLGDLMSGSDGVAPTSRLPAVWSRSGGVAISTADELQIDLLMASVYCAWEMSTQEEAQLAISWARRMVAQSRLAIADLDETTYLLVGQYLQTLIRGRRPTAS